MNCGRVVALLALGFCACISTPERDRVIERPLPVLHPYRIYYADMKRVVDLKEIVTEQGCTAYYVWSERVTEHGMTRARVFAKVDAFQFQALHVGDSLRIAWYTERRRE